MGNGFLGITNNSPPGTAAHSLLHQLLLWGLPNCFRDPHAPMTPPPPLLCFSNLFPKYLFSEALGSIWPSFSFFFFSPQRFLPLNTSRCFQHRQPGMLSPPLAHAYRSVQSTACSSWTAVSPAVLSAHQVSDQPVIFPRYSLQGERVFILPFFFFFLVVMQTFTALSVTDDFFFKKFEQ